MFIGIDLINIHRIKKIIDNKGDIFINRIFTKLEIFYRFFKDFCLIFCYI